MHRSAGTHDGGITWMDVFFQANLPTIIGGYGLYNHVHPTVIIVTDEAVQTDDNTCEACDYAHPNTNYATCASPLTPAPPIGS